MEFEKVIQGTLIGGFHVSQLVARHMVERDGGKIVFISSVQAVVPIAGWAPYGAAKAGLDLGPDDLRRTGLASHQRQPARTRLDSGG